MTFYEAIGGESGLRALVDRFYDVMDADPRAQGVRAMHPADLGGSRDKLFWFLSGWTGGPPEFTTRFGHPRLRARHLPFAIGDSERDQWMMCMDIAMEPLDPQLRAALREPIASLADHMRNRS